MKRYLAMILTIVLSLSLSAVPAFAAGTNLVTDGGFESGNAGSFVTEYKYVAQTGPNALYNPLVYAIGNNPSAYHNLWTSYGPHSGSYMMIVNGADEKESPVETLVWGQSNIAVPAGSYEFSLYAANSYPDAPAKLDVYINGTLLGTADLSAIKDTYGNTLTGVWQQYKFTWNAASATTANIEIKLETNIYQGNDFALDDISLVNVPSTLLISGLSWNNGVIKDMDGANGAGLNMFDFDGIKFKSNSNYITPGNFDALVAGSKNSGGNYYTLLDRDPYQTSGNQVKDYYIVIAEKKASGYAYYKSTITVTNPGGGPNGKNVKSITVESISVADWNALYSTYTLPTK